MADPETTINEQIVREAPDIEAFKLGLLQSSRNLANIPLQNQIPQQKVAGLSNLERGAIAGAGTQAGIGGYRGLAQSGRQTLGAGLGVFNQGVGALSSAEGQLGSTGGRFQAGPGYNAQSFGGGPNYTAQQFGGAPSYQAQQFGDAQGYTAQGFDPNTISQFQNPFEDQAVQQALTDIRRQGDIATNQQDAAAVQAGAFGGSRQGIQRTELARNVLEQQGRTAAGMRQAGFQNAAQQAQQAFEEQQRRQQGQAQFGTQTGQQAFEDAQRRRQAESQFGAQTGQQAFEDSQRRAQSQAQFGTQTGLQAFEEQQRRAQAESQFGTQTRQQAFEADKNRGLQRAQQYQGIAGQYGNLGQAGSNVGMQQLQAAEQAQNQGLKEIGTAQTLGGLERTQQQAQLDSDYNLRRQQLYEPYTRLSWLSDQYKGAPSSQSSLGSITSPTAATPSAVQQIGAIGTGILGAASASRSLFG